MKIKRKHWIVIICALALGMILYLALFAAIRHRAMTDYECLRRGERPTYSGGSPRYLTDGGTVGYVGFGYTVYRLHRFDGPAPTDGRQQQYVDGTELEFKCRSYFPVLNRLLEDRSETSLKIEKH